MDDGTLAGLTLALAQSPDNHALRGVLVQARLSRDEAAEALALMSAAPEPWPPSLRLLGAEAALQSSAPARALALLEGVSGAEAQLHRASALSALGRLDEARAAYKAAISENPTLEDPELAEALKGEAKAPSAEGRPVLRLFTSGGEEGEAPRLQLPPEREPITFADVGGLDDLKQRVRRKVILPLQKPSLFQRFKRRAGGGVLLYGPPGCGKTLMARATAGECQASFLNVAISDILDMYVGQSEQNLKEVFTQARESAPSVLFFDEVEALGGKRQHSRSASGANLVSLFLAEMDGFASANEGVLILAATNVPWSVDPAFRRPGRFDRVLFVPPPDRPAREAILRIHLAERPTDKSVDVAPLAKATSGFSGADLQNLVETAIDLAIEASLSAGSERPLTQAMLEEALTEVKPTTSEWLTTARNYARYANEGGQYDEVLAFLKKNSRG